MSNYLAIATVSATLKHIVQEALQQVISAAEVRIGAPPEPTEHFVGANIYLFQIVPNPSLRNDHLPTRTERGAVVAKPELAVDLNYLLTFYAPKSSKGDQIESEILMGCTMTALEAIPVLTREKIQETIGLDAYSDLLSDSNLMHQTELVRFTPAFLTLDELHKIWTVFQQSTHRQSIAYTASVVMLEADLNPERPLPVGQGVATASPRMPPRIEGIVPAILESGPDAQIACTGTQLDAPDLMVAFDGVESPVLPFDRSPDSLGIHLPPGLRAGRVAVRLVSDAAKPPAASSNTVDFVLQPRILEVRQTRNEDTGQTELTLTVDPTIAAGQRVDVWLNECGPTDGAPRTANLTKRIDRDTTTLVFPIGPVAAGFSVTQVEAGTYLARVQVDRIQYAESRLLRGKEIATVRAPKSLTAGAFGKMLDKLGIEHSSDCSVSEEVPSKEWRITDPETGAVYLAIRSGSRLTILTLSSSGGPYVSPRVTINYDSQ